MPYVYKITNKINNKCYVGYTSKKDVEHRIREHFSPSVYNNTNTPLYNSIKKYGKENFTYDILFESGNVAETLKKEIEFIEKLGDYNLHSGGNVPPSQKGNTWKHTEEAKIRMRKPKGIRTEKHKKNLSDSLKGKSPWNKNKIGVQTSIWKGQRNSPMVKNWKIIRESEEILVKNLTLWCEENGYTTSTVKYHLYKKTWPYKDIIGIEKMD
jgi:group I intron endonuclease